MASIVLGRYEAEEGDLPNVCMSCGAPATERKRRRFISHPLWVYLLLPFGYLPYVVVAAVLTVRVRCYTLFCARHKSHWRVRSFVIWGSFAVIVVLIIGSNLAGALISDKMGQSVSDKIFGFLCIGSLVLMFGWLISIPLIQLFSIHVTDVSERHFVLVRVSSEFVQAVKKYRDISDNEVEDDDGRKSRRRRLEEPYESE